MLLAAALPGTAAADGTVSAALTEDTLVGSELRYEGDAQRAAAPHLVRHHHAALERRRRRGGRFTRPVDGTRVARLPLGPALRAALAAGPVEVAVTVPNVESESALDVVITKGVRWRVALPASS
jgi:hypothetical protein